MKIAVDGPAGAGKSTVAREVAHRLNLAYLDTGSMYRAVTLKLIRQAVQLDDLDQVAAALNRTALAFGKNQTIYLDGEDVSQEIRSSAVNSAVSRVAALSLVRRKMVEMQQEIASRSSGIVMDGRDIASRVMPDADLKIYLDADLTERARRRREEQLAKGLALSLENVIAEISERDRIDSQRADSPLSITPGTIRIDTTEMTFDQVVERVLAMAEDRD